MAISLNVIALISGGKDSLFSILHCQAHGHAIVALANLHPTSEPAGGRHAEDELGNEDIDSYMYQTVGHGIIPLYEQALGVPLYRQEIKGKAVNSSRDYDLQEQDETEDLVPLLRRVMQEYPEANAVSTGAILSTYQRTRIESVALRLGLTPLSFLWQYPLLPPYSQSALLHDMAAVGQQAIIIKTASGGLDESFLGLDVANQRTIAKLSKTMARFGEADNGAIVGEGGEFETLALDGPGSLWKSRIRIEKSETRVIDGGQTVLKLLESRLEEKAGHQQDGSAALRIPELWDEEFKRMLDVGQKDTSTQTDMTTSNNTAGSGIIPLFALASAMSRLPTDAHANTLTTFTFSNLTSDTPASSSLSPSRQLANVLLRLNHILAQYELLKSHINHCTLILRCMSDFTILNPVYAQFFDHINPPARVTIAAGSTMPNGVDVMLSVILDKAAQEPDERTVRQGLHVQSRSYWAPANIGPYSQAISISLPPTSPTSSLTSDPEQAQHQESGDASGDAGEIVYIAGQIPLNPSSMEPYTSDGFLGQAFLSLQHLWRIGRAKKVRNWTSGVAFIPCSLSHPEESVRTAQDCWKQLHTPPRTEDEFEGNGDENEDIDPWDQLNSHTAATFNDVTYRAPLPDYSTITPNPSSNSPHITPPCFIAEISSLPRGVDIEWSATGLTSPTLQYDGKSLKPAHSSSRFLAVEITGKEDWDRVKGTRWANATLYIGRGWEWNGNGLKGVQWIPCFRVWGNSGDEVNGVLIGRVDEEVDG
jgi:diphthine-ammonia ligase